MLSPQSQVSTATTTKIAPKSAILDRKIDETAVGLQSAVAKRLHSINETNAAIIVDYVASLKSEINFADRHIFPSFLSLYLVLFQFLAPVVTSISSFPVFLLSP
jgi:hypothetical protein